VAGEHDDRRFEAVFAQDAHRFAAVNVGKADIHDHEIDLSGFRRLHTLRTLSRFGVQAFCLALILLVVLGPPSQLATLIAFAGAGLTVALKDFIVSFIGWFMLMGKNGVHAGDWVEINSVCGEVLEVTLFHTVMLETGAWTDPGHPTGRKVTFNNAYAIEGHYFNFTTSGQWLWDEIEFLVPPGENPSALADSILQMVTRETAANAQLAEQEWSRLAAKRDPAAAAAAPVVSAAPVLSVRPSGEGINGRIRYVTRANERFQTRTRLYHLIVETLHAAHA
jgi:small-conductance mechanosensitive channel